MLRRRGVRRAPHLFGFSQPLGDECALWCAGWHRERCWAPTLGSWSALQTAFASGPPPPPTPPVTDAQLQGGGSEYAFNLGQGVALDPVTCQSGRRAMSHVCAPTNPQPSAPPPPARSQPACRCLLHYLHEPGGSERCNARFFVDQQSKRVYVETVAVRHRTRTMQSVCGLAELDCILHRRPWTLATSFSSALATRGGATGRSRWEHAAHQSAHCQCCRRI